MARLLWGKVYYKDIFAGIIREEPGDRVTFTYDDSYTGLEKNLEAAKDAIANAKFGNPDIKNNLIELIGKRWNGTFALIGKALSKKQ